MNKISKIKLKNRTIFRRAWSKNRRLIVQYPSFLNASHRDQRPNPRNNSVVTWWVHFRGICKEYICNVQNSIKIQKHIIFLEHVIRLNVSSANIYTSFFANMEISDIWSVYKNIGKHYSLLKALAGKCWSENQSTAKTSSLNHYYQTFKWYNKTGKSTREMGSLKSIHRVMFPIESSPQRI